ncbi:DUF3306 domain-containing protein [Defluviimonas salinarum]|uniref:DUF3306 domain-containing protein n=1 Tax=Defluviimonas salinarum TaxID=2992147 RepID=A0ABT3IXD3_9RHOB|nr:DUF3306 domain-containing protein [Defluviimonas salinarum]MCW3780036.1 DUF3306 domain-containing protein [Defluviimonas salinarum]
MSPARPDSDFWSRRRAAVAAEAEAEVEDARAAEATAERAAREAALAGKSDAEILDALGLADPDTLERGDDFAAFLKEAVPEHLRRRALRRLWRSNPVLANLDGLVDHGEDYTDAATVRPDLRTAYQVGRGMLRHLTALAAPEQTVVEAAVPDEIPEPAPEDMVASVDPIETAPQVVEEERAPPRRHMRFTFDDACTELRT